MTKKEIINLARYFLLEKEIHFLDPGQLGRKEEKRQEVIFQHPQALDPKVAIIDPPDIRVWVSTDKKTVTLIYQM